ncbi:MAG TPA: acyl-CoA desaturase [Gaiellaceae bacterium]|jgi:stearoyl-CoA desaturase (delta-9 desaturase)|nr:acyl-CoA desaturase [Gaiellaceae bacterium]
MNRAHKLGNLLGVVLPFLGLIAAIGLLWQTWVGWTDLMLLAAGYVLTGVGITVGYHRLFTHRAFQTKLWVRWTFAVLGSMAVEGPVLTWVADHRKHHQFSDVEGDPHSPHAAGGNGFLAAVKNLFHAHIGWLFVSEGRAEVSRYVPDMLAERGMKFISRTFLLWLAVSLLVPAAIGYAISGTWQGALTALLWGGAIRVFLLHHVTFSINSICHFWGRRNFKTADESRNVWLLSLISFGESWHNNHHAFPTSAFHGMRRLEATLDPGGWVITGLEKIGLATKVVRIPRDRQSAKSLAS